MPLYILCLSLISFFTGAGKPGDPVKAELLFVGDAMQHQAQLDRAKELGSDECYDYSDCLTLIAPQILSADYAICNLEVPLGGRKGGYTGFPCFSAPDEWAYTLQRAGFDMFLTANNHTLDRRDYGLRRTLDVLNRLNIDHIGTYKDAIQRKHLVPFIKNINGIKIGFLNYTYGTNGIEAKDGAEVALIDRRKMADEIKATRDAGAELVIVCMHWGVEYVLTENSEQRSLANFLMDNGVDMIIGGHPHVIQPMKVMHNSRENKDVLVVYSLGNFISNMKTQDTKGGALVRVFIERDKEGKAKFKRAEYDTFFVAKPGAGIRNFRVVPSHLTQFIPTGDIGAWHAFNNEAERIFSKNNIGVSRAVRNLQVSAEHVK